MLKTVLVGYAVLVALVFLLSFLRNLYLEKSGLKTFKKRGNSDEETNWSSGG
jgi:hypothetical protein